MAGKSFSLLRLDLCHWSYHLSSLNVSVNFSVSHLLRRAGNQFLSCYFCVCVCSFFFFFIYPMSSSTWLVLVRFLVLPQL